MENRRCLYCGRKIHPALRPDAKYCGRSCKSSYHRDKKEEDPSSIPRPTVPLSAAQSSLAGIICQAAPADAIGYILRRQGCPLGNGVFDFPVPTRRTKRHDGSLTNTTTYRLWPFEPPRVPWPGPYELLFWVPSRGLLPSEDPQRCEIHLGQAATVPRAAFDHEALWRWEPLDDTDAGSADAVQREVLARAPAGAIGYVLSSSSSPQGPGRFVFPPTGRVSRRANLGVSSVPYYSLDPFELPCVPWAGMFVLAYELGGGVVWLDPDPSRRLLRVGMVFPYADYDRPSLSSTALLFPTGAQGLEVGAPLMARRVLRRRRLMKR